MWIHPGDACVKKQESTGPLRLRCRYRARRLTIKMFYNPSLNHRLSYHLILRSLTFHEDFTIPHNSLGCRCSQVFATCSDGAEEGAIKCGNEIVATCRNEWRICANRSDCTREWNTLSSGHSLCKTDPFIDLYSSYLKSVAPNAHVVQISCTAQYA